MRCGRVVRTAPPHVRKYAPAALDHAIFRTLYHPGLRSGESVKLDAADVHTVHGAFGVCRSTDEGATWIRINDDQHQYGYLGTVITGDPNLYGGVCLGGNGRGVIYGTLG